MASVTTAADRWASWRRIRRSRRCGSRARALEASAPSVTDAVAANRAANPAARARYQSIMLLSPCRSGQASDAVTAPVWSTSRAATPCSCRRAAAESPQTSAAVLQVLAAEAVSAQTVAVRTDPRAGRPVVGSMTWCSVPRFDVQARPRTDEVASPPWVTLDPVRRAVRHLRDVDPPRTRGSRRRTRGLRRSRPGQRGRAARGTRRAASSAVQALAVAPRSSRTSGRDTDPSEFPVDPDRGPVGLGSRRRRPLAAAASAPCSMSSTYPASSRCAPTVGSTAPSVRRAASSATSTRRRVRARPGPARRRRR